MEPRRNPTADAGFGRASSMATRLLSHEAAVNGGEPERLAVFR